MKRYLILALICITALMVGCSSGGSGGATPSIPSPNKEGVVVLPYEKPLDFKQFEVYVGTSSGFAVTGFDGSAWTSEPNTPGEWNGTTNTLHTVTANTPLQVNMLKPGVRYYFKVVAVDKSNQRSIPSPEVSEVAGNSQQSATVVIAAADASPASKAGADYVCAGTNHLDQTIINEAVNSLPADGGKITLTEGNFHINYSIVLKNNVTLEGQGSSTIINTHCSPVNYGAIINGDSTNGNSKISLINFVIHGWKISLFDDEGTGYNIVNLGISLNKCNDFIVSNVEISNLDTSIIVNNSNNINIQNVNLHNNMDNAMSVEDSTNGLINSSFIHDNTGEYLGGTGIALYGTSHISVEGCQIYKNYYSGLLLTHSSNNSLKNNTIKENGQSGNYSANDITTNIILRDNSSYNDIQTNTIRAGDLTAKPKYGIRIDDSTCNNNLIANNDCVNGGLVAGISDAGTNTNFGAGNRTNDGIWRTSMIIGHDEFDGTGNLVNDLTGKAWTMTGGTWSKTGSGTAYVASASGVTHAYLDTGCGDGSITWGVSAAANNMRFLFRFTDNSNKWFISADTSGGVYEVYKQAGGTASVVASINVTPAAGDKIKVDLLSDKIITYINDVQYVDLTDSFNKTATKHGIYALATSAARWDYFKMEAV